MVYYYILLYYSKLIGHTVLVQRGYSVGMWATLQL
jgi:hypothetical protein